MRQVLRTYKGPVSDQTRNKWDELRRDPESGLTSEQVYWTQRVKQKVVLESGSSIPHYQYQALDALE